MRIIGLEKKRVRQVATGSNTATTLMKLVPEDADCCYGFVGFMEELLLRIALYV